MFGEVVHESGGQQSYIYFMTTAIISLLYMIENGCLAKWAWPGTTG
jgi:hypothetical protein